MKNYLLLLLVCWFFTNNSVAQTSTQRLLEQQFQAQFSPNLNNAAATYTYFRLPQGEYLPLAGLTALEKASDFWQQYGSLFHIHNAQAVQLLRHREDAYGQQHLVFGQMVAGLPVFGAEITLHFNRALQLTSAGGQFVALPSSAEAAAQFLPILPTPTPFFDRAARAYLRKNHPALTWEAVEDKGNFLLSPALLGSEKTGLHWVKHLHARAQGGPEAYQLFLELASGQVIESLQEHCDALNRRLYNQSSSNLIWQEGNPFPGSLNTEQATILRASAEIYHLFNRSFGINSYDNNGGIMESVYNASNLNCPNASAGDGITYYCPGTGTDDVVGHEWAHVYTLKNSALIYAWESGAINEAFSDIFGEVIDLLNSSGNDSGHNNPRNNCTDSNNMRWKVGEDATAFNSHLRDMWSPNCRSHPASKNDNNYRCSEADNGGVHSNSGVFNRFFSLLTDGGSLNDFSVTGLGLTKATHIVQQAHANYITRTTNYHALADALEMAANDLLGINLPSLTVLDLAVMASGEIITTADLLSVSQAILATQMRSPSNCTSTPILAANAPAICQAPSALQSIFREDWEAGLGSWQSIEQPVNPSTWDDKPWQIVDLLPDGRSGKGAFGPNPFMGDCIDDLENGIVDLISPAIIIPNTNEDMLLQFWHYLSIERSWDGGLLYISRNSGPPIYVNLQHFVFNGYNRSLVTAFAGNDNPEAGKFSFTGSDANSTSGSWGLSQVNLSAAGVQPGDTLRLIFRMSHDGCNGWLGWYLDDIELGFCAEATVPVTYHSFTATAEAQQIRLQWQTEYEESNLGFAVERSSSLQATFHRLGWVAADDQQQYFFTDTSVLSGVQYYYRLKQLDADGSYQYSSIVTAKLPLPTSQTELRAFPNPNRLGYFQLEGWEANEAAQLQLFHTSGQLVSSWPAEALKQPLSLGNLPKGVYLLRLGKQVCRLVVQ